MKRKRRAIILDDEESIRHLLEILLKSRGYEVLTYQDPSLCPLQQSHECQCGKERVCADVVITDIDMPNVSGLDFVDAQKRKGCKIQNIAILSGRWSEMTMKHARDCGCAVFEKPVALSVLADWLDQCEARIDQRIDISDWFLQGEPVSHGSAEPAGAGDA